MLPALVLLLVLLYGPTAFALVYGTFETSFLRIEGFNFPQNFVDVLEDVDVRSGALKSLVYLFGSIALTVPLGLGVSLWVHRMRGPLGIAVQVVVLVPWVISMVVAALLWRWLFAGHFSLASYLAGFLGIDGLQVFDEPRQAMGMLIFVSSWRTVGYAMIMILAGLKGVPPELYEAASVDGASSVRQLVSITLPQIRVPLTIVFVMLTLSYLNVVTVPMVLTGGGPGTATNVLSLELYRQAFLYYDFGKANALAACMFALNMVFVLFYVRVLRGGTGDSE